MMDPGVSLRPSQLADLTFGMMHNRFAILHDPAVGKTPPTCVYMWWLWDANKERTIWVMPSQLFEKNKAELLRFTHFHEQDVMILNSDPSKTMNILDDPKVIIMGAARFKLSWQWLLERFPDINCVVGDETHMFWATHSSAQTQALFFAMEKIKRFCAMTGSLIKGRLSSAFPVIHVIEPLYYASWEAFEDYHHVVPPWGGKRVWTNGQRIADIMGRHAIKRSFEAEYGPESKVIVTELCRMKPLQRENYEKFEANAILELEDSFLSGSSGGQMSLRCNQIMAHPETWGLNDGETTGKDDQLLVHLAQHKADGTPGVIYPFFVPEQQRIVRLIKKEGMTVALLNGDTSPADRGRIDREFREGKIQWIVGSPQVATVGYNWDHCNHVIFTTAPYGDDTFYQAYRRCIRGARTTPLLITVLEYANSIDQRKMAIIRSKSMLAKSVEDSREVFDLSVN